MIARSVLLFILIIFPMSTLSQPLLSVADAAEKTGVGKPPKIWAKDPFAPPAKRGVKEKSLALKLSAIIYSKERSSAVINGKRVHVGDMVRGREVLEIKRNFVILKARGKLYRLEMKE